MYVNSGGGMEELKKEMIFITLWYCITSPIPSIYIELGQLLVVLRFWVLGSITAFSMLSTTLELQKSIQNLRWTKKLSANLV